MPSSSASGVDGLGSDRLGGTAQPHGQLLEERCTGDVVPAQCRAQCPPDTRRSPGPVAGHRPAGPARPRGPCSHRATPGPAGAPRRIRTRRSGARSAPRPPPTGRRWSPDGTGRGAGARRPRSSRSPVATPPVPRPAGPRGHVARSPGSPRTSTTAPTPRAARRRRRTPRRPAGCGGRRRSAGSGWASRTCIVLVLRPWGVLRTGATQGPTDRLARPTPPNDGPTSERPKPPNDRNLRTTDLSEPPTVEPPKGPTMAVTAGTPIELVRDAYADSTTGSTPRGSASGGPSPSPRRSSIAHLDDPERRLRARRHLQRPATGPRGHAGRHRTDGAAAVHDRRTCPRWPCPPPCTATT